MINLALIQNNKVVNIIVANDSSYISAIASQYQYVKDASQYTPSPQIGYGYNSNSDTFSAPVQSLTDYVNNVVMPNAAAFSTQMQSNFISWNIANGISQLNKTAAVLGVFSLQVPVSGSPSPVSLNDTLNPICPSLTVSISVLQYHIANVANYSSLAPFITAARLIDLMNQIQQFLGLPLTNS